MGVWALAGFYLSLGPSLAAQLLHSENLLWGGILIFLLTGLGAAASAVLAKTDPSGVMLGGCLALIAGALVTFAAIETSTPAVLFVGTAVAGLGFGPAFMGAYRVHVALAPSDDRAGLITAIYIVSYLATGIPAVIGGIATSHYGLHDTALVYSLVVAALAAVGAGSFLIRRMRAAGGRARHELSRRAARPVHRATMPSNRACARRGADARAELGDGESSLTRPSSRRSGRGSRCAGHPARDWTFGEPDVPELARCVRLNLDCGEVCAATGRVVTRQTGPALSVLTPGELDAVERARNIHCCSSSFRPRRSRRLA